VNWAVVVPCVILGGLGMIWRRTQRATVCVCAAGVGTFLVSLGVSLVVFDADPAEPRRGGMARGLKCLFDRNQAHFLDLVGGGYEPGTGGLVCVGVGLALTVVLAGVQALVFKQPFDRRKDVENGDVRRTGVLGIFGIGRKQPRPSAEDDTAPIPMRTPNSNLNLLDPKTPADELWDTPGVSTRPTYINRMRRSAQFVAAANSAGGGYTGGYPNSVTTAGAGSRAGTPTGPSRSTTPGLPGGGAVGGAVGPAGYEYSAARYAPSVRSGLSISTSVYPRTASSTSMPVPVPRSVYPPSTGQGWAPR